MDTSRISAPGQKLRSDFPRFGLPQYADRFPAKPRDKALVIEINGSAEIKIDDALAGLPRATIHADFHCVTTWSFADVTWEGVAFSEFFEQHVQPEYPHITGAVLYAQDGYRTTLLLKDLLADGVILVDTMDGKPISLDHGAPLRLIAPAHYGYKNVKYLKKIAFFDTVPVIKRGLSAFLDHPRARVKKEERGRWVPGWFLRYVFRPLITRGVRQFQESMVRRQRDEEA